jgi:hypothetical protein
MVRVAGDAVIVAVSVTVMVLVAVSVSMLVSVTVSVVVKAFVIVLSNVEVLVELTVEVMVSVAHPPSMEVSSIAPEPARKSLLENPVGFLSFSFIISSLDLLIALYLLVYDMFILLYRVIALSGNLG